MHDFVLDPELRASARGTQEFCSHLDVEPRECGWVDVRDMLDNRAVPVPDEVRRVLHGRTEDVIVAARAVDSASSFVHIDRAADGRPAPAPSVGADVQRRFVPIASGFAAGLGCDR